jgi:hypothetical protein
VSWRSARFSTSLDAVTPVASRYLDVALRHAQAIEASGEDPAVVARAVRFLGDVYAIPPMGEEVGWFDDMLTALLGLLQPSTALSTEARAFLLDLRAGIDRWLEEDSV